MNGARPPESRGSWGAAPSGVHAQSSWPGNRGRSPSEIFSKFRAATLLDINTELWENDLKASAVVIFLNCEKYNLSANIELCPVLPSSALTLNQFAVAIML